MEKVTRVFIPAVLWAAVIFAGLGMVSSALALEEVSEGGIEKVERSKTVAPDDDPDGVRVESEASQTVEVRCEDGVCEEDIEQTSDSVCHGFLCDDGTCVSDEAWCGVDFDFEVDSATVAADSVCSGYLCNDGTCVSSEAMCDFDFDTLPGVQTTCPAGAPVRCGDGVCAATPDRCDVRTPTDELRRANAANLDTNVCDGVTCSDGSCAATADECGALEREAAEVRDLDSDGDGMPDVEQAQDYNSSRGNKPSRAVFDDSNRPDRPEVSRRAGGYMKIEGVSGEATARAEADGDVYCWGRAEDGSGQVYTWGRGICVALEATTNATATAQNRLAALEVRAEEVRAWSEEERTAWREYRESSATTSPEDQLLDRMIEQVEGNERIQSVRADDAGVEMDYQAEMRLFGFIPLQRTVSAQVAADGAVEVDYPWYRFLSRVPEQDTLRNALSELQALLPTRELDKATPALAE